jgi:AhpD family alkylhydroperoxidase
VVSQGEYPSRQRLQALVGLNAPSAAPSEQPALAAEPTSIFNDRIAELVALGAAIACNCEPCFRYHHRQALKLGVAREDMIQAVNVALRVKEEPARAMVRLAQKSLIPEAAQAGGCCGGGDGSSCC